MAREVFFFTPTNIPGCQLWLDAADTTTLSLSGSNVTQWRDKSGLANNASVTAGSVAYSSQLRALVFNGSSYLTVPSNTFPTGNSNYSLFIISSSGLANYYWIVAAGITTAGQVIGCVYYPDGRIENGWWTANIQTAVGAVQANVVAMLECIYLSPTLTTLINGISLVSSSSLGVRNNPSGPNIIGARPDSSPGSPIQALVGNIYEILCFTGSMTTSQRQQIEGYLMHKWGLIANLPSNHPFKGVNPLVGLPLTLVPTSRFQLTNRLQFTPRQISGCSLWYDAADISRLTLSGSSVINWTSKGTSAISLTNSANYPTYVTNAYNTLGTLRFTFATNQSLSNASVANSVVQTNINHTIFLVHNPNANNSTPFGFLGSTGATEKRLSVHSPEGSSIMYDVGGRLSYSYPSQAAYLNGTLKLETYTVSGGSRFYRRDGTQLATNGTITSSFDANQILYIGGAHPSYPGYNYGGDYCEIVWYNTNLTTIQIQEVEGYLAHKWGLQTNLPVSHPYRRSNPSTLPAVALGSLPQFKSGFFNPRTISGCSLWLDPSDLSTFTFSGSNITQWRDKSATAAVFTGMNNPVLSSTKYGRISPISFGGSAYFQSTSFVYTTSSRSAFFVFDETTEQNNVGVLSFASSGTDYNQLNTMVYETGFKTSQYLQVAQSFTNGGYGMTIQSSTIGFALYSDTFGSGRETAYVNGSQTGTTTSAAAFTNSTGLVIGARMASGSVSNQLIGVIGEIILYNRPLPTNQRQQVEGYLAWKWGLEANLPSTHPYKLFPPSP